MKPDRSRILTMLVAALVALSVWLGWKAFGTGGKGDVLATTLSAFERQNRLTVFSAQLAPVVAADDERLLGMLHSRQVAVIPARVDYTLDLSAMTPARLAWDAATQRLAVRLPPLEISRPNLDEARAQYLREGVWITAGAQDKLTRDNTRMAETEAGKQARNTLLLDLAQSAAKVAVEQNLVIPLQVAGYRDASVTVRFDGEKETP